MTQKYVTNFDVGTENILIRDSNVMHGEGLINVKFPPDSLSPLKGDGSNETTILQNMINYAISENMALFFPEGVYAVDSINVAGKVTLIGSNAIIRKIVSSATPVINATGFLTMRGIDVDGNISVLTAAVVGLNVENAGFDIADCSFTGCSDCIHAIINTQSSIANCSFTTFNENGISIEGSSFIKAFGIFMNVQSNTAMKFMKLDNSNNIIYGLESMSEVPVGIEIIGNFNYISARIPNCENPVNDSGQNNSYDIIGQKGKRFYQNYELDGEDIILNPTNPITYKTPSNFNPKYDYIPAKDKNGDAYKIAVLKRDSYDYINVCDFGVVGDGETDNSEILSELLNKPEYAEHTFFFPDGQYRIESTVRIEQAISIQGTSPLTCLLFTPNTTTILHFNCSAAQTYYSYFGGFALVYTGTGDNTGSQGILVDGNMYFNFNVFENIMFRGLEVGFNNSKINTGNPEIAFDFNQFINVRATNEGANPTSYGIRFFTGSGTGNSFVQCNFVCSKAGISWTTQTSYSANIGDILISSCHFGGAGSTGIDIYGGNAAYHAKCSITNCQFDAGVAHGVTISTFDNLFISNCEFGGNVDYQLNNVSLMQLEYNSLESEFAGYKNTTGASSVAIGTINIQSSSCLLEVFVAGDIHGAGERSAYGKWLACSPAGLKEIDNVNMDDYLKVVATKLNNDISISASMTGGTTTGRIYFTVKVTSPKFIPNLLSDT